MTRAVAGCPGSATSRRFAATFTSGVEATTAATLWWNQRYAPPAAEPTRTSRATNAQPRTVRNVAQPERFGGSGWRYTVIGERAPGGSTGRPLASTVAPRPMPLFNVVRIRKARATTHPRVHQDSRR